MEQCSLWIRIKRHIVGTLGYRHFGGKQNVIEISGPLESLAEKGESLDGMGGGVGVATVVVDQVGD